MFPTKTTRGKRNHALLESLAVEAMQLRVERMTGYPRSPWLMTQRAFLTLQMVEQMVEQMEIVRRERLANIVQTGLGVKEA